ncbi:MAG TPA: hypothetical protein VGI84_09265 [Pseudonocardiaceae bacterium]
MPRRRLGFVLRVGRRWGARFWAERFWAERFCGVVRPAVDRAPPPVLRPRPFVVFVTVRPAMAHTVAGPPLSPQE